MGTVGDSMDFDWLVIGSGFGGSVSALRLTEKGYRVGVLECGRRYADDEFPSSTADLKRYFWNPRLGMKGIFRLTTSRTYRSFRAAAWVAAASATPTPCTCRRRRSSRIASGPT